MRLHLPILAAALATALTVCLAPSSAWAADEALAEAGFGEVYTLRLGPQPFVRTAWRDLTDTWDQRRWTFEMVVDAQGRVTEARFKSGPAAQRDEALRAALAMQFKPFEREGRAVPVRFEYTVEARTADYTGPADRAFPSPVDTREIRIAMLRTSCQGNCASYRVEVQGDGRVTYRGYSGVLIEGEHHWRIAPAAVAQLLERFSKAEYFKLGGYYSADATDLPTYITRLSIGAQQKIVLDYGGGGGMGGAAASRGSGGEGPHMPQAVTELEEAIDEISGVKSWIAGNEHTMAQLQAAHWNFRSPAAGEALHRLVGSCNIGLTQEFIQAGVPISNRYRADEHAWPLIDTASRCGNRGLIKFLEARGALARKQDATTFLQHSVDDGFPEFVAIALKHGASLKPKEADDAPLIIRAAHAYTEGTPKAADVRVDLAQVVAQLIAAGADPNARDKDGNTALHETGRASVARVLLGAGADPNARNARGQTPLFNAYYGEPKPVLIEAGADIKARDLQGRTALFDQEFPESAEALIRAGADVNAKDLKGLTPLETARRESVTQALLVAGASLPADREHLLALMNRAAQEQWPQLRPSFVRAAAPPASLQSQFAELKPRALLYVGKTADWVAITEDAVWTGSTGPNAVHHIDPATDALVASVLLPGEPCAGLASGFGLLWVPLCGDKPGLAKVDLKANRLIEVLPFGPAAEEGGVATSADSVWIVTDKQGSLARIDPASGQLRQTVHLPAGSYNVQHHGGLIFATQVEGDLLTMVDAVSGEVLTSIVTGPHPRFLTAGAGYQVWTLNQGDGTLTLIDAFARRAVTTVALNTPGHGGDIALYDGKVWTTMSKTPLSVVDATTNEVLHQWTGPGGDSLGIGHGAIWITDYKNGTIARIPLEETLLTTTRTPTSP